jgi:hypothetical protein
MDDYERFNRTGQISRDTSDYSHVPVHVRVTRHPVRSRQKKHETVAAFSPKELDEADIAEIRRLAAEGHTPDYVREVFSIGHARAKRIMEGGTPEPQKATGRPRRENTEGIDVEALVRQKQAGIGPNEIARRHGITVGQLAHLLDSYRKAEGQSA